MATLDDEQVATFNLRHDTAEDTVDKGVEGGIADHVMSDVNKEALVGGDGGCEGVKDVCESGHGTRTKLIACRRLAISQFEPLSLGYPGA